MFVRNYAPYTVYSLTPHPVPSLPESLRIFCIAIFHMRLTVVSVGKWGVGRLHFSQAAKESEAWTSKNFFVFHATMFNKVYLYVLAVMYQNALAAAPLPSISPWKPDDRGPHIYSLDAIRGNLNKEIERLQKSCKECPRESLQVSFGVCCVQGVRSTQDSAYYFKEEKEWALGVLLDGHGSRKVVDFIVDWFAKNFYTEYVEQASFPLPVFLERCIYKLQQQIVVRPELADSGSTIVLTFIDKKERNLYTLTVGDSEAFLCHSVEGNRLNAISLSFVYTWSYVEEKVRIQNFPDYFRIVSPAKGEIKSRLWIARNTPHPHHPFTRQAIITACSRSLGEARSYGAVSCEPVITQTSLPPQATVVLASCGVTEVVSKTICKKIISNRLHQSPQELAKGIVQEAEKGGSTDNKIAFVIQIS